MMKLAPEWVQSQTNDPVIRSPSRYRWTTAPASIYMNVLEGGGGGDTMAYLSLRHVNKPPDKLNKSLSPKIWKKNP